VLIDAEFDEGQIRLLRPMRFTNEYFKVQEDVPNKDKKIVPDGENRAVAILTDGPSSEVVSKFKRLTNAVFGEGYCYVLDKPDREILAEVLSDQYV
jgi:hypothetical protein